jgi:hypothetical protein
MAARSCTREVGSNKAGPRAGGPALGKAQTSNIGKQEANRLVVRLVPSVVITTDEGKVFKSFGKVSILNIPRGVGDKAKISSHYCQRIWTDYKGVSTEIGKVLFQLFSGRQGSQSSSEIRAYSVQLLCERAKFYFNYFEAL